MASRSMDAAYVKLREAAADLGIDVALGGSRRSALTLDPSVPRSAELLAFWDLVLPIAVPFVPDELVLYPPQEVLEKQQGYLGPDWPPAWVVIGDIGADPVIADTSRRGTPVQLALPGIGEWRPADVAPDPAAFLRAVAAWLRVLHHHDGDYTDEANGYAPKAGFNERLRGELRPVLDDARIEALVGYIET